LWLSSKSHRPDRQFFTKDFAPPAPEEIKEESKTDRSVGTIDEPSSEAPVSFGSRGAVAILEDDEPLVYHDTKKRKDDSRRVSFPLETVEKDLEKSKPKEPKKKRAENVKIAAPPAEDTEIAASPTTATAIAIVADNASAGVSKPAKPSKATSTKEKKVPAASVAVEKETPQEAATTSPSKKKGRGQQKNETAPVPAAPRTPRVKKAAASSAAAVVPIPMPLNGTQVENLAKSSSQESGVAEPRSTTPTRRNSRRKVDQATPEAVDDFAQPETPQRSMRRSTSGASPTTTEPAAKEEPPKPEDMDITPTTTATPPRRTKKASSRDVKKDVTTEAPEAEVEAATPKSKKRGRKQSDDGDAKAINEAAPPKRQKKEDATAAAASSSTASPPKPSPIPSPADDQEEPRPKKQPKRKRSEEPQALVEQNENKSTPAKKAKASKQKQTSPAVERYCIVLSSCNEDTKTKAMEFVSNQSNGTMQGSVTEATNFVVLGGKKRTLKTVLGIANGAWLVKSSWIDSCVEEGGWSNPDDFEASEWFPGARKSRNAGPKGKIFSKFKFFLHGEFEISHDDLRSVICMAGGEIVSSPIHAQCSPFFLFILLDSVLTLLFLKM
jgi:hypothetical protein